MAILANSTITLVSYLDAYGAAVEGGFEGSEEDFYADLGLVEDLPGALDTIEVIGENLDTLRDDLFEQNETLATIIADNSISQPERIELRATLTTVRRESMELYAKLSGEGEIAQALSEAADELIEALQELLDLTDYGEYDFDNLASLYLAYTETAEEAREAVSTLAEARLTDITAGQIDLSSRIGAYEEQLQLSPEEITMSVGGDLAMRLTKGDLTFISEDGETQIALGEFKIDVDGRTVMSIVEDEMRIPKVITSDYFGVGRIKFIPAYDGEEIIGTDVVFMDDPAEI
jgi:hypothetical protein